MAKTQKKYSGRILRYLLTLLFITIFAHLTVQFLNLNVFHEQNGPVYELSNRLDLDDEISIPTWLSQLLLLSIGLGGFFIAYLESKKKQKYFWMLIGIIGVLLSIDEGSGWHEFILGTVHVAVFGDAATSASKNAWLVLSPVIILAALILLWQAIRILPRRTLAIFTIGASVYLFGSVVIDILNIDIPRQSFLNQGLMVALEEGLELLGTIVVLFGMADYIEAHYKDRLAKALKQLKA